MKSLILGLTLAVAGLGFVPMQADAKRIGGGSSAGMQRSLPPRAAPDAAPAKPATPTAAPATAGAGATAAAAAPKRSWLGPIAGLAAGLGIAALMSHLGLGAEFGNFIMLALLAGVAFFAIRFLLRRFGPASASPSLATPQGMRFDSNGHENLGGGGVTLTKPTPSWEQSATVAPSPTALGGIGSVPAGFDTAGFERIAKLIFIRMQAANDSADLNDLRNFTTPEMFASIKLDLQDRGAASQRTDVVRIDAEVLEVATEAERQIVSVRFHGLIREEENGAANDFDEVWHLVKPTDGSREWAIAGIQQYA